MSQGGGAPDRPAIVHPVAGFGTGDARHSAGDPPHPEAMVHYDPIVHLGMHTGHGPRHPISNIHPPSLPGSSAGRARDLGNPLVLRTDPDEFHTILGDVTQYWYALRDGRFPGHRAYSASVELGTLGDSLLAQVCSLRASVLRNHLAVNGASHRAAGEKTQQEYEGQNNPSDSTWREKAFSDARQAFREDLAFHGLTLTPAQTNTKGARL